ncbi:2-C-methyl-D-erythritol 4-phosphate cytidylyltransferase [Spirochaetia bacterium]|nr:2-C-methyl-D-erythritol 4-phosphate cytidylyltransferase [Spirochaetia bacterium]
MNSAIILSGGIGSRFNDILPKQYQAINGKQIISFVIDTVKKAKSIDKLVIVSEEKYFDSLIKNYGVEVTNGGNNRNRSVRNGIDYINSKYPCENIIILDSVRPFIEPSTIDLYMELLRNHQAVATAKKITDSLSCYDKHIVDRERYYLLSSPEAFRFKLLYDHLDPDSNLFEITQQLPLEADIYLYFEYVNDLKITYKQDFFLAKLLIEEQEKYHENTNGK